MDAVRIGTLVLGALLFWMLIASARRRSRLEFRARLFEMIGAAARRGLPISRVLERMGQAMRDRRGRALQSLAARLDTGQPFGPSLEASLPADTLPQEVLATIRASEGTSALQQALAGLVDSTNKTQRAQDRISSALTYPGLLAIALIGTYAMTDGLLAELPKHATASGGVTSFVAHLVALVLWLGLAVTIADQISGPESAVHRALVRIAQRAPSVGQLLRLSAASRVLRVAAALSEAGLPLGEILRRAAHATRHTGVRHGVLHAARGADEGLPPEEVWQRTELPDFAIAFASLAVGGHPDEIARRLHSAAAACDRRMDRGVSRMLAWIQPVTIAVFGVLIALHFAMVIEHVQSSRLIDPGGMPW